MDGKVWTKRYVYAERDLKMGHQLLCFDMHMYYFDIKGMLGVRGKRDAGPLVGLTEV